MYPPKHHIEDDKAKMIEVIKAYPLATLISVKDNAPLVTHLPLVYNNNVLEGHIDIYNPQAQLLKDNNEVTIIFSGPQCYISPTIYNSDQLPTWNYIKVHLKGKVQAIESTTELKQSLIRLTQFLEAPEHKYVLEPNHPKLERNLAYIKMFRITITSWEGKFKLSQDKKPSDTIAARKALIKANKQSIEGFFG